MKRREQKQIDVLATARRDRRRVPLPFCLPRPPLSPLSFHTRTWIQGMRKWVPSPTGSGAMPETRSYMTARSPPSTLREKGRNVCECGLWRPVPQISRHMLGKQMQSNIGVGSEGACEDSRACACATPGAGNGGRNTTHTHLCTGSTSAPGPSRPPRWPRPPTLTRMRRLPWLAGRGRPLVRCVVAARARMKREVCVQHGAVVEATLFWPALSFFIHLAARPVERHALSTAGPAPSAAVLLEARPSSPATSVSQ